MTTSLREINQFPIKDGTWGQLRDDCAIMTGITGFDVGLKQLTHDGMWVEFRLFSNGLMLILKGTQWDYGSGPAVNTPEMIRASLPHDMFCHLTNLGLVPWSVRKQADLLFRDHIKEFTPPLKWWNPMRYNYTWRYAGVRVYSKTVAYHRRKEFVA